jgi:hypothetical protein
MIFGPFLVKLGCRIDLPAHRYLHYPYTYPRSPMTVAGMPHSSALINRWAPGCKYATCCNNVTRPGRGDHATLWHICNTFITPTQKMPNVLQECHTLMGYEQKPRILTDRALRHGGGRRTLTTRQPTTGQPHSHEGKQPK